ncbi:MAG: surface-adhesin E family protein [Alphaproteobacteria bacterium]
MSRAARIVAVLVGLATTAFGPVAIGASYYVVQSSADAWTVIDPQGVETLSNEGPVRRAWAVRVQRNIMTGEVPVPGYVRTLSEYDCGANLVRWTEFTAFSRTGATLVSQRNPNPEWNPPTNASDIYNAFRLVCRRSGGGGSVVSAESVAKVVISLMAAWDPPPPTLAAGGDKRRPARAKAAPPGGAAAKTIQPKATVSNLKPATR